MSSGSGAGPLRKQLPDRRHRMQTLRDSEEKAPKLQIDGADTPDSRRAKVLLWASMIFGILVAGVAFAYKLAEFIFTLNSSSVQGFADVPVTIYFIVAAGWLALLA